MTQPIFNLDSRRILDGTAEEGWPYKGLKVKFIGVPDFYYPQFIDQRTRVQEFLYKGSLYTVEKATAYSSWIEVILEVILEGIDGGFNWRFFEEV